MWTPPPYTPPLSAHLYNTQHWEISPWRCRSGTALISHHGPYLWADKGWAAARGPS